MKKLIILLTILTIKTQAANWPANYKNTLLQIDKAATSQDYESAYALTLKTIESLRNELKVGQSIAATETNLTKNYDEKVVSRQSGGLSIWSLLFSFSLKGNIDTTKMIMTNEEEASLFASKSQAELEKLQVFAKNYIAASANQIAHIKILTMKAYEYAAKMNYADLETLGKLASLASDFHFTATQNVTVCVQNNFIDRNDGASLKLRLFLFTRASAGASQERFGYSTKSCNSSLNTVQSDASDVEILNLSLLDRKMEAYRQLAFAKALANTKTIFPSFGNPYYE